MDKLTVGLFNDSFPPTIDGVANVTVNYAKIISETYGEAIVATPHYPHVYDDYPFEVLRYPSAYLGKQVGYRAGYPFDPRVLQELEHKNIDIIHTHCPFVSTVLARLLRNATGAPIVFTYHTKFDIDLQEALTSDSLRKATIRLILNNINACDEVWVVSEGAGNNLRGLGYTGDYIVMENGTDFARGRADKELVEGLRTRHGIQPGVPVFLYVGRMRWYKGIQLSLDGLKAAKDSGERFYFVLVGDGQDKDDIAAYARTIGLEESCVFVGSVNDRELLRGYFTMADLFLFPSTFDTSGIVVKEAAACCLPGVMMKGSCAAEGVADGETGFLIELSEQAMRDVIVFACHNPQAVRAVGERAAERVYLSWGEAVKRAYVRYQTVLDNAQRNDAVSLKEALGDAVEKIMDDVAATRDQIEHMFYNTRTRIAEKAKQAGYAGRTKPDEKRGQGEKTE